MTHITETTRRPSGLTDLGRGLLTLLRTAGAFAGRLITAEIDRRRTMALLGSEDHMLRDIGISRSDVHAALLTPVGEKASDRLSEIRHTHRIAERAQAREARQAAD